MKGRGVMYLDELDTVRFDVRNKDYENNYVFAQAAMMKNIIQGQKITLSQTQLFDSGIILKLLEQSAFVKFFEKDIINVSVFHKDLERLHTNNFRDVVIDKLSQGIDGDDRPPFYFSSIDALSHQKLYSDNEQKNIEIPRKIAIQILSSEGKAAVDYPLEQKEYFESLMNFADVINAISEPITRKNLKTLPTDFTLSDLIAKHLQTAKEYEEYSERDYIQLLQKLFKKLQENNQANARGAYYTWLDNPDYCEPAQAEKLKSIINVYYNLVVAQSVSQATDNLRELTFKNKTLDEIDRNILSDVCSKKAKYKISDDIKYTIVEEDTTDSSKIDDSKIANNIKNNILTWDRLYTSLPQMPTYTEVKQLYDNFLITVEAPYHKHHSVICKTVPIALTLAVGLKLSGLGSLPPEASNVYDIYAAIRDGIMFADVVAHELLEKSKVDDARARKLIKTIQEDARLLKGGK